MSNRFSRSGLDRVDGHIQSSFVPVNCTVSLDGIESDLIRCEEMEPFRILDQAYVGCSYTTQFPTADVYNICTYLQPFSQYQ